MKVKLTQATPTNATAMEVLVVDADPATGKAIRAGLEQINIAVRVTGDVQQALLEVKRKQPDVIFINLQIGDNSGAALIETVRKDFPLTDIITLSRSQRSEVCLTAWRAGATDILFQPLSPADVNACISKLRGKRGETDKVIKRNVRLRQACKKLNKARHEIGQQVDLLCQDLVKAYQDLAQQLNQTQMSAEFADYLGAELDIESLLRKTLQWILKRVGPTNAAVFLPDAEGNFTLGAYLDLDTGANSLLTEVMAQTIAKAASNAEGAQTWNDDATLDAVFGQSILRGRAWMGSAAVQHGECIAVVVAFRKQEQPFDLTGRQITESACPVLGEKISRLIRVHNRYTDMDDGLQNS